jgi:hypothetical protein
MQFLEVKSRFFFWCRIEKFALCSIFYCQYIEIDAIMHMFRIHSVFRTLHMNIISSGEVGVMGATNKK